MRTSRSAENVLSNSQSKKVHLKRFPHEEQFQTESSVHQYYTRVKSKQNAHKQKLQDLEKNISIAIGQKQTEIMNARALVDRLSQKFQEIKNKQVGCAIFWRNALDEVQATLSYFLWKLGDYYDSEIAKQQILCDLKVAQLVSKLQSESQKREEISKQFNQHKGQQMEMKQKLKNWIENNLKSKKTIECIQNQINSTCTKLKSQIQRLRASRKKQEELAKMEFEKVSALLMKSVEDEKRNRQINKQQIVEAFESLFHRKCFNPI